MSAATKNGKAPAQPAQPTRATRPNVRTQESNGKKYATSQAWGDVYEAAAYEEGIAAEAAEIWQQIGAGARLDRATWRRLYPLLRRPIHPGHIIATSKADGKPYDSDGVRSAQVLIDRMNNVLGTEWWSITRQYEADGKLCVVTVRVFDGDGNILATGESYGGMDRANTAGNLRKASFTNAAKLAFAAIGPSHEIYTQAIDYDPDLLPGAIEDQNRAPVIASAPPAAAAPQQQTVETVPPERALEEALALQDDFTELRHRANEGMANLGATASQRVRELSTAVASPAGPAQGLNELITRISNAFNSGK